MQRTEVAGTEVHEDATPSPRSEMRETFFYCLKVFVSVRVVLAILALLSTALLQPNVQAGVPGWDAPPLTPGWHNLFTAWERWDALWFLRIATDGYAAGDFSAAFFPLYPLTIRLFSFLVGGHPLAGGLLASNLAALGALVVVHELTKDELGTQAARRTVLYLSVFPTAYFLVAPYSEALFLLCSAGAFLAARRRNWEIAGVAAALAAATRSIGIVLVVPLAIEALTQAWAEPDNRARFRAAVRPLLWSAFTVMGTFAYLLYWKQTSGDWLTPLSDQNGWLREFHWPWESFKGGTREAFKYVGAYSGGYHQLDWLFVVAALIGAIWVCLRARVTYAAYTVLTLLIPLCFVFGGRPFMSMPRFILVIFPLYWALAAAATRWRAHEAIVAVCAGGLGLMTLLYVNWYYVF